MAFEILGGLSPPFLLSEAPEASPLTGPGRGQGRAPSLSMAQGEPSPVQIEAGQREAGGG